MLRGVVDSAQHVGGEAGTVRTKGFERHELGLRRNQVNDSGDHGAVTVGGEGPAIENAGGGLIYNGNIGLIDLGG